MSQATFDGECKDIQDVKPIQTDSKLSSTFKHIQFYAAKFYSESVRLVVSSYNCLNFLDVDECAGSSHGCKQLCKNLPGGFECQCQLGYRLEADQKTCVGKKLSFFALERVDV